MRSCHQRYGIARGPVLASLLVIVLVELADKFLKDRTHRVVVYASRRKVDLGVKKLIDECSNRISLRKRRELIAELEVVENVLNIRREAVQIILKVCKQLLLVAARLKIAQGEP
jgi:hypothetical protein